ncbi:MAG: SpoIIE family protein phosphatase, partial [Pseudomonadota bacterium]
WDGSELKESLSLTKRLSFNNKENAKLEQLVRQTLASGFNVGISEQHPMHLYLLAKSGEENNANVSVLLVENANFFALFGEGTSGETYLFHTQRGLINGRTNHSGLLGYLQANVFNSKIQEGTKEANFSEKPYLASYAKVGRVDLYIVSLVDKKSALSAVQTLMKRSILFTSLILCILIIIGVFASNGLTSALRGLAEATSKVMDGDFSVRVEQKSRDEIGTLAQSFNKMTEEVSRLMEKTAENARMEAELQTAQTVQDTLFPLNEAKIGPVSIYGKSVPASECGGDWWHYSQVGNRVFIWIGDATGHGVPAALLTSAARAVASVIEGIDDIGPGKALQILNRAIYSTSKGEMMMTFFLACYDIDKGTLTYSNASHDPPFYLSHEVEGKPKRRDYLPLMEINNPRLGENPNSEYTDYEMKIEKGDKIVFYTDGIVDVRAPEGDLFGERRFLKSLSQINDQGVNDTVNSVFDQLSDYRKDTPLDDDVTLILVEFDGGQAA